jgi:hypothetical protein
VKPYLLFAGETHYPKGGMNDFQGDFDSILETQELFNANYNSGKYNSWEWCQVIETATLRVLFKVGTPYGES